MSAVGDNEAASLASWQQWGQILADQQRMLQFQSLLAMSSALPNMTPKDMAAFCGLGPSDLAGLAAYTTNISSLTPSSLASMGITSSQLSSLAQIASLTGANPQTIAAQANKQAQFEQEYLRHLIGGRHKQDSPFNFVLTEFSKYVANFSPWISLFFISL